MRRVALAYLTATTQPTCTRRCTTHPTSTRGSVRSVLRLGPSKGASGDSPPGRAYSPCAGGSALLRRCRRNPRRGAEHVPDRTGVRPSGSRRCRVWRRVRGTESVEPSVRGCVPLPARSGAPCRRDHLGLAARDGILTSRHSGSSEVGPCTPPEPRTPERSPAETSKGAGGDGHSS